MSAPRRHRLLARVEAYGNRFGFARGYDSSMLSAIFTAQAMMGRYGFERNRGDGEWLVERDLELREHGSDIATQPRNYRHPTHDPALETV